MLKLSRERLAASSSIKDLEEEWALYKYLVLEHSPSHYQAIRNLLKDKEADVKDEFLALLTEALDDEPSLNQRLNAFDHVWGHFKHKASAEEKNHYRSLRQGLEETGDGHDLKDFLYHLSFKYGDAYLQASYFFIENQDI